MLKEITSSLLFVCDGCYHTITRPGHCNWAHRPTGGPYKTGQADWGLPHISNREPHSFSPWDKSLEQGHGKGQAPPTPRLKLLVLVGEAPIGTLSLEHSKEATPYMLPRFRCDLAAFKKGRIHKRPHIKGRRSKRPHAKKAAGQKGRSSKKTTITEIM